VIYRAESEFIEQSSPKHLLRTALGMKRLRGHNSSSIIIYVMYICVFSAVWFIIMYSDVLTIALRI
jgi:hypothetical protein